jgi:hypothetical protein
MNMTTTLTAHHHRGWPVVVLAALATIAVAIMIAVSASTFTDGRGADHPVPNTAVTNSYATPTPGNGLACPIHQPC